MIRYDALDVLPVRGALPGLTEALDAHGTAVLVAPPGTGKTTLVPLALAGLLDDGRPVRRVVVAEPRRIAARAAARRMAWLLGEQVGASVGYTVRGERVIGRHTRVEVVTTGVLLQRLQRDQELPGVDVVVLDECHERHLDADTTAAFLVDVRAALRPELRLVAASATTDAEGWAELLGGAPVVEAAGVSYPVEVVWAPPVRPVRPPHGMRVDPALLTHVASTVRRALAERAGDVLCFLPGVGEIARVAGQLRDLGPVEVLQVHGRAPAAVQDAVLSGGAGRRVVLATSVAESSLTVPGVRVVVDSGLAREPRVDHARGLSALTTVRASQAAGRQRAGRAGREAPGAVYRCWAEAEDARLTRFPSPEIKVADLTAFALQTACWGDPDASGLALLDPPPSGAMAAARSVLTAIGAVDATGRATDRGTRMSRLGLHPRLARALLDAAPEVGAARAAEVVALLSEEPPREYGDELTTAWRTARHANDAYATRWRTESRRLRSAAPDAARHEPAPTADGDRAGARSGDDTRTGSRPRPDGPRNPAPTTRDDRATPRGDFARLPRRPTEVDHLSPAEPDTAPHEPAPTTPDDRAAARHGDDAARRHTEARRPGSGAPDTAPHEPAPAAGDRAARHGDDAARRRTEARRPRPDAPDTAPHEPAPAAGDRAARHGDDAARRRTEARRPRPDAPDTAPHEPAPAAGDRAARHGDDAARRRTEARRPRPDAPDTAPHGPAPAFGDDRAVGLVVALAFPERVGRAQGGSYLMVSGTRAEVGEGSALRGAAWVAVAVADRPVGAGHARVRLGVGIDEDTARSAAGALYASGEEVHWADGDVVARRVERLGAVELAVRPLRNPDPALVREALLEGLRQDGLGLLRWSADAEVLRQRLAFLRLHLGDPWPDVSENALHARVDEWLEPELGRARRRADLGRIEAGQALDRLLPWASGEAGRLDGLAPERLAVPSGSRIRVDYSDPERPVLAVKLQEMFGLRESPVVAGVPVVVHLLSPAGRPAAVTADLASFWKDGYKGVRAELRGRYPKHPWPEDPATAEPTRHTNARLRR